jgi:alanine dehydrogenase
MHEYRVGLTPASILQYVKAGHQVLVETQAGLESGFSDLEYIENGAVIVPNAKDIWTKVDMLCKVKEPLQEEYPYFRPGLILYTFLHLSADEHLTKALENADLIIGAVLLKGAKAPKLIKRSYYEHMKKGAVIIDVAIDQGGSTEISRVTYHQDPVFVIDGIIHYCVANMPGAVPKTSTEALNHVTLKYGLMIANKRFLEAVKHELLYKGVNTYKGMIRYEAVAETFQLPYEVLIITK